MKYNLLDSNTNQELLIWYDTITKQNHFTNKNNIIIQNDRSMGVTSCGILSDTFFQNTQTSHIAQLTKQRMIINYFHYVDDILLIFDSNHTNIQAILTVAGHFKIVGCAIAGVSCEQSMACM